MDRAKRQRRAMAEYREVEREARRLTVEHFLRMKSPVAQAINRRLLTIDPTGKLLCAYYQHMRDAMDHVLARKDAGQSDADITAAFERDLSLWLAKGPERIIAEFDARMETAAFGLPAGAPTH